MRIWFKIFDNNSNLLKDTVIEDYDLNTNRTKKVLNALSKACNDFDLAEPIWLEANIGDFKRYAKTRFLQDAFVESVPFAYLEMHVIEED